MKSISILIVIIVTALLSIFFKRVIDKLLLNKKLQSAIRALLISLKPMNSLLVWGYGLLVVAQMVVKDYEVPISLDFILVLRELFLIVMITWLVLSWKGKYEQILIEELTEGRSKISDASIITGLGKVTTILVLLFSSMIILQILEFDYTAIIAFGGVGGIAVGLSAKDIIANFFGGLMIHINRPFTIGDLIKSTNKNFEGVVEQIGWYMTSIRSLERRPTYIPNALITDAIIENGGRMYNRRFRHTFGVRYADYEQVPKIVDEIKQMLLQHSEIVKNQILMVNFTGFLDYSLAIEVYCFTRKVPISDFWNIQQDLLLKIGDIIRDCGAELAFPTQTLHVPLGFSNTQK